MLALVALAAAHPAADIARKIAAQSSSTTYPTTSYYNWTWTTDTYSSDPEAPELPDQYSTGFFMYVYDKSEGDEHFAEGQAYTDYENDLARADVAFFGFVALSFTNYNDDVNTLMGLDNDNQPFCYNTSISEYDQLIPQNFLSYFNFLGHYDFEGRPTYVWQYSGDVDSSTSSDSMTLTFFTAVDDGTPVAMVYDDSSFTEVEIFWDFRDYLPDADDDDNDFFDAPCDNGTPSSSSYTYYTWTTYYGERSVVKHPLAGIAF